MGRMYCREFFRRTIRCVSKKITSIVFPVRFHAGASVASQVSSEVPPRGRDLGWGMIGTHGVPPWSYRRTERACSRKSYRTDGFATFGSIRSFRQDCAAGASGASRVSREVPPRGRDLGWGMIGHHGVPPCSYRRTERACSRKSYRTDGFAICCGKEFALTSVKCKLFCL